MPTSSARLADLIPRLAVEHSSFAPMPRSRGTLRRIALGGLLSIQRRIPSSLLLRRYNSQQPNLAFNADPTAAVPLPAHAQSRLFPPLVIRPAVGPVNACSLGINRSGIRRSFRFGPRSLSSTPSFGVPSASGRPGRLDRASRGWALVFRSGISVTRLVQRRARRVRLGSHGHAHPSHSSATRRRLNESGA
jgi:hypothetical protein